MGLQRRTLLDIRLLCLILQELVQFLTIRHAEFADIELWLAVHFVCYCRGSLLKICLGSVFVVFFLCWNGQNCEVEDVDADIFDAFRENGKSAICRQLRSISERWQVAEMYWPEFNISSSAT